VPRSPIPSIPPVGRVLAIASALASAAPAQPPFPDSSAIPPLDAIVRVQEFGEFRIAFYRDEVPNHVAHFLSLAAAGFYDGLSFHRVVPGLLVQTGDPNSRDDDRANDGSGSGGFLLPPEPSGREILRGIVVMAWRGPEPGTAGSQWFVSLGDFPAMREGTPIGEVVQGMDVVDRISQVSTFRDRSPLHRVVIESIRLAPRDAPPPSGNGGTPAGGTG
jgi:peptidyl-prolyl cis-trans isomerase B (cyclophilin B)